MASPQETAGRKYVLFRLGGEDYGLPIERVQSIIRYEPSTPVPKAPEFVEGVINLRGKVIPVVDLSRRLTGVSFTPGPLARIVVTEGEAGLVGLAVDSASEVATFSGDDVKPPPESALAPSSARSLEGVADYGGRLVILLDLDQAVPKTDYAQRSETEVVAEEGEGNA